MAALFVRPTVLSVSSQLACIHPTTAAATKEARSQKPEASREIEGPFGGLGGTIQKRLLLIRQTRSKNYRGWEANSLGSSLPSLPSVQSELIG
jgi:hypothetical protein